MKTISIRIRRFTIIIFTIAYTVVGYSALSETQSSDQTDVKGALKPVSSTNTGKESNKALVNEPHPRGQLLYENHCGSCHESMVHIRAKTKVRSYEDIQYWVGRWSLEINLKWSAEEIDSVVQYLNSKYYHF